MQFRNVKNLIKPLIIGAHAWQSIDINGNEKKSKYYFSDIQWILIILSLIILFKQQNGISKEIVGYVMSAFSISVSLFMSLLISIFEKFENTHFDKVNKSDDEIARLIQKKNFFKRFITITSYLVILSILIIVLCSLTYIFNISKISIELNEFTFNRNSIDIHITIRNFLIFIYRIILNYFLLNYLYLTFFITGSAYEYYISEIDRRKII